MDQMVLKTQQWLNKTYKGRSGYVEITEDGVTGWNTMKALITGLQIELGISSPNGNFGPATTSSFSELSIGSTKTNQIYILQGGLYCKGYDPNGFDGSFGNGAKDAIQKLQSDAGIAITGTVNALLMKSILSMDSFKLLTYGEYNGDENIRTIQRNLNRDYSSNKYFSTDIGLVPCDGIYGRSTNKALLYALQIEEGISVPNGVFGPATKENCPVLSIGSTKTRFVYLLQYALYCNGFDPNGFDGSFGNGAKSAVTNFQTFSCLSVDGVAGMQTWASLLVSTGDNSRKGTMCDCATTITDAKAKTLKNNGYISVGRYLTGKFKMSQTEIQTILSNGLRIFPIFETGGYQLSYFTPYQGNVDAKAAIAAAHDFGFDANTIIYFTVDFDALDIDITTSILPYFSEIFEVFKRTQTKYKIGIYAPRHVCSRVSEAGISCSSFVCDMSSGFSGNLGYPLPKNWAIDQISTITIGSGEGQIEIDNNISSGKDMGVASINPGNSANGIEDTYPAPDNSNKEPSLPSSDYYNFEHIVISGYEGDVDRFKYNFIETALKRINYIANWKKSLPINSKYSKDTISWIIESNSYSDSDKENFKTAISSIADTKIIFIKDKNELINYFNTASPSGNSTRKQQIAEITWFGHGFAEISNDDNTIAESTPFLAFGKDFHTNLDHRFRLSDINKLNKSSFKLDFLLSPVDYKTQFYTCNTGTRETNSFAYNWYKHLNASVKACVNRTDYNEIMVKQPKELHPMEWAESKKLRKDYGFCIAGSKRYPIPDEDARWVYWK